MNGERWHGAGASRRLAGLAAVLVLAACESSTDLPPVLSAHEIEFHEELGIDLSQMVELPSGLWIRDELGGSSQNPEVTTGTSVGVHYRGWLPDGTEFANSQGGAPLRFVVGNGGVIEGFAEGVLGMRQGGQRLLLIPPHLGYGSSGGGGGLIPPNSWLVFRISLVET